MQRGGLGPLEPAESPVLILPRIPEWKEGLKHLLEQKDLRAVFTELLFGWSVASLPSDILVQRLERNSSGMPFHTALMLFFSSHHPEAVAMGTFLEYLKINYS